MIKVENGVPSAYSPAQFRADNPGVLTRRHIPDDILAEYEVYREVETAGGSEQVRDGYELVAGTWQTAWRDRTAQEVSDALIAWRATARVEALAARLTLIQAGHWDNLLAAIAAIPDAVVRAQTQAWVEQARTWKRSSPRIASLGAALGFSDEQIDGLFTTAAQMDLD